eukprot:comp15138_c0_seq1/m.11828 comp15138_c0_seq1/g.11828  ORF comp15138_c0_seq1/g.11828 comp15138_c0_seq1/m.11828 type:complete len:544 (-) comp15138_c0_seq1:4-1635(-)
MDTSALTNPDTVASVHIVLDDELEQYHQELLTAYGLTNECTLLKSDPLPVGVVEAARVVSMNELERYNPPPTLSYVSPRNEIAAATRLQRVLSDAAQKCATATQQGIIQSALAKAKSMAQASGGPPDTSAIPANEVPADEAAAIKTLTDWFLENGGKINGVEPAHFRTTGRGVVALQSADGGSTLVSVPETILLNADRARESPMVGQAFSEIEGLDDETLVMLFVLYERFVNPNSFWKPFFDVLPLDFDTAMTCNFEELMELEGTTLLEETVQAKDHLRAIHSVLFEQLSEHYPDIFPTDKCSFDNFMWVRCLFDSRAMQLKIDDVAKPCLVPFADFINYTPRAHVAHQVFDSERRCVDINCFRPCEAGEQLFLNYGSMQNWQLVLYYGFALPNNQYDAIPVELCPIDDDHTTRRIEVLEALGLLKDHYFQASRPPTKVLAAMRVCVASKEELDQLQTANEQDPNSHPADKPLNDTNEVAALRLITTTAQALMSGLPTSIEEDRAIFQELDLSPRRRAAVTYRLGVKETLTSVMEYAAAQMPK